eukprot:scaffold222462_cov30-Tisochrysis_lutea.AAC.2
MRDRRALDMQEGGSHWVANAKHNESNGGLTKIKCMGCSHQQYPATSTATTIMVNERYTVSTM